MFRLSAVGAQQGGFFGEETGQLRAVEKFGNPVEIRCLRPAAVRQECLPELVGSKVSGPQLRHDLGLDDGEIQVVHPGDFPHHRATDLGHQDSRRVASHAVRAHGPRFSGAEEERQGRYAERLRDQQMIVILRVSVPFPEQGRFVLIREMSHAEGRPIARQ